MSLFTTRQDRKNKAIVSIERTSHQATSTMTVVSGGETGLFEPRSRANAVSIHSFVDNEVRSSSSLSSFVRAILEICIVAELSCLLKVNKMRFAMLEYEK